MKGGSVMNAFVKYRKRIIAIFTMVICAMGVISSDITAEAATKHVKLKITPQTVINKDEEDRKSVV